MGEKLKNLFHNLFTWRQSFPLQEHALKRDKKTQLQVLFHALNNIIVVWISLIVISVLTLPFCVLLFSNYPDFGYFLVKILSVGLFSFINWYLVNTKIIRFTRKNIIIILGLSSSLIYLLYTRHIALDSLPIPAIIAEELIFLALLTGLSYLRGFRPQISNHTEGYMDYGFTNSVYHSNVLPPKDPWYAGATINYYWYGYYLIAYVAKLTGVSIGVMYNIGVALMLCLPFMGLYSIGLFLLHELFGISGFFLACIPAIVSIFGVSPHYLYLVWQHRKKGGCWLFGIRSIIPKTINEYPHYSYIINNLRGHLVDLSFGLVFFALSLQFFLVPIHIEHVIFLGLLLSLQYMTNSSDAPVWALFLLLVLLLKTITGAVTLQYTVWTMLQISSLFYVFTYPFLKTFKSFFSKWGLISRSTTSSQDAMLIWGFWTIPLFITAFLLLSSFDIDPVSRVWRIIISMNGNLFLNNVIIVCSIFIISLILLVEYIYVKDIHKSRANTFYKFNHIVNLLLPWITFIFIIGFYNSAPFWYKIVVIMFFGTTIVLLTYFPLVAYQWMNIPRWQRFVGLDVFVLLNILPADKAIVEYLLHSKTNSDVLVEGSGDSFSDSASISIYSAVPTVVGWKAHEWLWRSDYEGVQKRRSEVEQFYSGNDISGKWNFIKKYNITYIVVTDREKKLYPKTDILLLAKLGNIVVQVKESYLIKVEHKHPIDIF